MMQYEEYALSGMKTVEEDVILEQIFILYSSVKSFF